MISIEEALNLIKTHALTPRTEIKKLSQALGHVLAENIKAPVDSPTYTNSAMDGFAVSWLDVEHAFVEHPCELEIIGESQAGHPYQAKAGSGQAVRISTGAIIPAGTDTVIPIEDCQVQSNSVQVRSVVKKYQHVRYQGEEFTKGHDLLEIGRYLNSAQIGLLASMGLHQISVFCQARVALIITGSELVAYDANAEPHQLRDSNGPMLTAAVEEAGGLVTKLIQVKDDFQSILDTIKVAETQADIILYSGGVSVGPHDHVKDAATESGYHEVFWRVNQKPGKPLFFASKPHHLLLGLPGNPVSAFMCFKHYGDPLVRHIQGAKFSHATQTTRLSTEISNTGSRANMIRIEIKYQPGALPKVQALDRQGSHMLSSVAHADGYFIIPPKTTYPAQSIVTVYPF